MEHLRGVVLIGFDLVRDRVIAGEIILVLRQIEIANARRENRAPNLRDLGGDGDDRRQS